MNIKLVTGIEIWVFNKNRANKLTLNIVQQRAVVDFETAEMYTWVN